LDLSSFGKWMVIGGLALAALGMVVWLLGKTGIPFGHLLGDIHVERPGFSFSFPVVTCVILSVVITVILNIALWFFRR